MATDLWRFKSDVGYERADVDGMRVEALDGEIGKVESVVDRMKGEIEGAPALHDLLKWDEAYQEALTRHYGATSGRA
jgi:hypothetical protein